MHTLRRKIIKLRMKNKICILSIYPYSNPFHIKDISLSYSYHIRIKFESNRD